MTLYGEAPLPVCLTTRRNIAGGAVPTEIEIRPVRGARFRRQRVSVSIKSRGKCRWARSFHAKMRLDDLLVVLSNGELLLKLLRESGQGSSNG